MDLRQVALETPLLQESHYIARWHAWITVRELPGTERAELLQQCTEVIKVHGKPEGKVNLKKLYPMLAILSIRYPDPDAPPDMQEPHYASFPGLKNTHGTYVTDPHPKAGELVFSLSDVGPLNKTSGTILEQIAQIASPMSGLRPEDVEEKKENDSGEGMDAVESTAFTIE